MISASQEYQMSPIQFDAYQMGLVNQNIQWLIAEVKLLHSCGKEKIQSGDLKKRKSNVPTELPESPATLSSIQQRLEQGSDVNFNEEEYKTMVRYFYLLKVYIANLTAFLEK